MQTNYFSSLAGGKPFLIAEVSGNHNQSLEHAKSIVKEAAKSGVNAIKLQTYTADCMTIPSDSDEFIVQNKDSIWYKRQLYDLFKEGSMPWEWHQEIFALATDLGIYAFSSPFSENAVDFLEELNTPFYKIASPEITDLNLIKKVSSTGKPLIISTGMATIGEIEEAVETARNNGVEELALLKCTSVYPSSPLDSNIKTINYLKKAFKCEVGLSDHSLGIGVAIAAVAHGATVIEKHICLRRSDGGIDSSFSMEPKEFLDLRIEADRAIDSIGEISLGPTDSEISARSRRRSLYFVKDLKKGEAVDPNHVRSIRPGKGLSPKYLEKIIGMRLNISVKSGTPVSWDLFQIKHDND